MTNDSSGKQGSSDLSEMGLRIRNLIEEIKELYLADSTPWTIGYSGGKDSTAVVQLVMMALKEIDKSDRNKLVHIISTDTLVENPIVSKWVEASHLKLAETAKREELPIVPILLKPEINNSFWVNLIGRGYPAPRNNFRWCTDRLKIKPSNQYIRELARSSGEVILLMGMRKAESIKRSQVMTKYESSKVSKVLSPSSSLPNCYIYPVIGEWSNDDVWLFLMQYENPWGYNNKELLAMYAGATADGECPLVVDTSTPSCGSSRFGCWVCTLVEKDKSMASMIKNDSEKEWMAPLLAFRNNLDFRSESEKDRDRARRDYRRMNGTLVATKEGKPVPGPYTQETRILLLRELLLAQAHIKAFAPPEYSNIEIICLEELEKIRDIWIREKSESEDLLPIIYEEVLGQQYPGAALTLRSEFSLADWKTLEVIAKDTETYKMLRDLINVEKKNRYSLRRSGIYNELERKLRFYSIRSREEAEQLALQSSIDKNDQENHIYVDNTTVIEES